MIGTGEVAWPGLGLTDAAVAQIGTRKIALAIAVGPVAPATVAAPAVTRRTGNTRILVPMTAIMPTVIGMELIRLG